MRYFGFLAACVVTLVLVAADLRARAQDLGGASPHAKGASNLESCMSRATVCGKAEARARKTEIASVSARPTDGREFDRFFVLVEFRDGALGFFQGGTETETDQWVAIPKGQAALVGDGLSRIPSK